MADHINLVKLCVGAESVESLSHWQSLRAAERPDGMTRHVTRMWPRRASELLAGGSLYWVIRGSILARQGILSLDESVGQDGIRRCAIVLDPAILRTAPVPRRPFQGWRYLEPADAPPDLTDGHGDATEMPAGLRTALADIGVL